MDRQNSHPQRPLYVPSMINPYGSLITYPIPLMKATEKARARLSSISVHDIVGASQRAPGRKESQLGR